MIYRIDVVETSQPEAYAEKWECVVAPLAERPGFESAHLHRVYKNLNRSSYQFVSIVGWRDEEAYEAATRGSGGQAGRDSIFCRGGLYMPINDAVNRAEISVPGNLIVTNPYRIAAADGATHAEMWNRSKEHMQTKEGFVSAYLYQTVDPNGEYYFVSRAEWRSEELFMRQFEGRDFRQIIAPYEGIFSICLSNVVSHVEAAETITE